MIFTATASETSRGWFDLGGRRVRCALGEAGVKPAAEKREGDKASPIGVWPIRRLLWRPDKGAAPITAIPAAPLARDDGWCETPDHPDYNRQIRLPHPAAHETMWRDDDLYDLVLVLGHNDDPVVPGMGSAIFLHLARPGYSPTQGCVALARADVEALLAAAKPGDAVEIRGGLTMTFATWFAFALAAALMGLIPGPGVTSIVGSALSSGRRTALASVAGMALGNALCMSVSLAGAGAVLAASAVAFTALKWAGALYLIGLGVVAIARSRRGLDDPAAGLTPITTRAAFLGNLAIGTFHPKTIVFFVAFAPQFIRPSSNYVLQAAILIATFTVVVGLTDTAYALAASRAAGVLRSPRARLWSKRAGGGVLIVAGVATAAASRG